MHQTVTMTAATTTNSFREDHQAGDTSGRLVVGREDVIFGGGERAVELRGEDGDDNCGEERSRANGNRKPEMSQSAPTNKLPSVAGGKSFGNANSCAGCREPIRDKFIFSVIDLNWHQNCVQCSDCCIKLNDRCYTFGGKLYCKADYLQRFGPKCFACRELIERSELVQRIKEDLVYHLKCFNCSDCNRQLKAGEQMHIIEGKRLLCKQDFHHYISTSRVSNNSAIQGNNAKSAEQHAGGHQIKSENNRPAGYFNAKIQGNAGSGPARSLGRAKLELEGMSGGEEELEEEVAIESEKLEGEEEEVAEEDEDEDDDEDLIEDDFELLIGSADCLDANNRENDENQSSLIQLQRGGLLYQMAAGQELKKAAGGGGPGNNQACHKQISSLVAAKRKRRRRAQKALEGRLERPRQQQQQMLSTKKLANRNGESILNGASPSSILANSHPTAAAMQMSSQQQQQQQQLTPQHFHHQHHQHKSMNSSSASTASNSSTSSSLSGGRRNHHHNLHASQHSVASSGGPNGGQSAHKPTRVRTVLNEKQLQTLRDCYAHNPRPDALMKEQLVELTGLSPRVIRVWFQNKRCKDKKKTILNKQMLQHEKDGRHFSGMTVLHGVPMVASSPVQYDDHSTLSSGTPANQQANSQTMLELQPAGQPQPQQQPEQATGVGAAKQEQQERAGLFGHSPAGAADIHGYQPPWKNLIEYAHQQQQGAGSEQRLNAASPRYQQLMGQIHGYSGGAPPEAGQAQQVSGNQESQQQQPQFAQQTYQPDQHHQMGHLQQPPNHLHQFQR